MILKVINNKMAQRLSQLEEKKHLDLDFKDKIMNYQGIGVISREISKKSLSEYNK